MLFRDPSAGAWFIADVQLENNWSEVLIKGGEAVRTLQKRLSVKVKAEVCAAYVFPLVLYRLPVPALCRRGKKAIESLLSSLLLSDGKR